MKKTLITASVVAIATLAFSGCGAQPQIPMSCELGYSGDYKGDIECRDLKSLDKFKGLTSVKGNLTLNGTYINIDGLSNLEEINGGLSMFSNELKNIDGFKKVKEIKGSVSIRANSLENLDGFKNMNEFKGDFFLNSNSIENLDGLSNLKEVGGKFSVTGNKLNSIKGLTNLTSVGDDINSKERTFSIQSRSLKDITGVGNLNIDGPYYLNISQGMGGTNKMFDVRLKHNSKLCETIRPYKSSLKKNYANQFGYYTDYHDIYSYICETE